MTVVLSDNATIAIPCFMYCRSLTHTDATRAMVNSERALQKMREMLDEMVCIFIMRVCVCVCVCSAVTSYFPTQHHTCTGKSMQCIPTHPQCSLQIFQDCIVQRLGGLLSNVRSIAEILASQGRQGMPPFMSMLPHHYCELRKPTKLCTCCCCVSPSPACVTYKSFMLCACPCV